MLTVDTVLMAIFDKIPFDTLHIFFLACGFSFFINLQHLIIYVWTKFCIVVVRPCRAGAAGEGAGGADQEDQGATGGGEEEEAGGAQAACQYLHNPSHHLQCCGTGTVGTVTF